MRQYGDDDVIEIDLQIKQCNHMSNESSLVLFTSTSAALDCLAMSGGRGLR